MIGEMKARITLQAQQRASDGRGGTNVTWKDKATVWAEWWTVGSSEGSAGRQDSITRIPKARIWFRPDVRGSWRVKKKNKYYNITGIDPDKTGKWLFLTMKEVE
jgi:SPP1 family predicted phage head-tail adaptor